MQEKMQPTLELLIRQEIAVKQLYEAFAITFQEHEEFWSKLAEAEQHHAELLARLRTRTDMETIFIDEMQLSPQVIKNSTIYAYDKRDLTLNGSVDVKQAFSLAENVERFLIDGVFIKLEGRPQATIPKALLTLAAETKNHQQIILQKQKVLFR
jgi:hypothetical protein